MRYLRKNRISIDLDTFNQLDMLKAYFNLRHGFKNVLVKKTLHGYHVMAYKKNITQEDNLHYRLMFGDCINRGELDHFRLIENEPDLIETLFKRKKVGKEKGEEMDFNVLAEPFWSVKDHV